MERLRIGTEALFHSSCHDAIDAQTLKKKGAELLSERRTDGQRYTTVDAKNAAKRPERPNIAQCLDTRRGLRHNSSPFLVWLTH